MAVNKQNQSHVETLVRKYVGARKAMFIIIIIIIIIIVIIIHGGSLGFQYFLCQYFLNPP